MQKTSFESFLNSTLPRSMIVGLILVGPSLSFADTQCVNLTRTLTVGSSGQDVINLQQFLDKVYGNVLKATGYYGTGTRTIVSRWQKDHGISQTGSVGPLTRSALACTGKASTSATTLISTSSSITGLKTTVQGLLDQVAVLTATGTKTNAPTSSLSAIAPATPISIPTGTVTTSNSQGTNGSSTRAAQATSTLSQVPSPSSIQTYYVSTTGLDTYDGSSNAPFATVAHARDVIRARIQAGTVQSDITVNIMGGVYVLQSPLMFTDKDSGPGNYHIIYQAIPGATVRMIGGLTTTSLTWTPYTGSIWKTQIDPYKTNPAYDRYGTQVSDPVFRDLYINAAPAIRARVPNLVPNQPLQSYDKILFWSENAAHTLAFPGIPQTVAGVDIKKALDQSYGPNGGNARCNEPNPNPVEIVPQMSWVQNYLRVQSYDVGTSASGTPFLSVYLCDEEGRSLESVATPMLPDQPFHLENSLSFLDSTNEWFYDTKTHTLYYQPAPGVNPNGSEVIIPTLETLWSLRGTSPSQPIRNITIRNIIFEGTTFYDPLKHGIVGIQAGTYTGGNVMQPGAVEVQHAANIDVESNTFRNLGATGLRLTDDTNADTIANNNFSYIGGNCLAVGDGGDWTLYSNADKILNNSIKLCGQRYAGSVGIFARKPANLLIQGNTLAYLPYTGINMGWGWEAYDTDASISHPMASNSIVSNTIYNVMQLLYDGGAIYTLSRQPSSTIDSNHISSIVHSGLRPNHDNQPSGIYLDEGSDGFTVKNNLMRLVWPENGDLNSMIYIHTCHANAFDNNRISNDPAGWTGITGETWNASNWTLINPGGPVKC